MHETKARPSSLRTGLDHVAFLAESFEDLEAWARWLDAREVPHSEIRHAGSVATLFDFTDPDGIQIEFIFVNRAKARQLP
ncbi:MAG TPA: VOC family protein [Acidimicrobiales bacterium]|nr:VOC family protein [Acidimicrobiales bacterium]